MAQHGGPAAVINASLFGIIYEVKRNLETGSNIWGVRNGITCVLLEQYLSLREPSHRLWKQIVHSAGATQPGCANLTRRRE